MLLEDFTPALEHEVDIEVEEEGGAEEEDEEEENVCKVDKEEGDTKDKTDSGQKHGKNLHKSETITEEEGMPESSGKDNLKSAKTVERKGDVEQDTTPKAKKETVPSSNGVNTPPAKATDGKVAVVAESGARKNSKALPKLLSSSFDGGDGEGEGEDNKNSRKGKGESDGEKKSKKKSTGVFVRVGADVIRDWVLAQPGREENA